MSATIDPESIIESLRKRFGEGLTIRDLFAWTYRRGEPPDLRDYELRTVEQDERRYHEMKVIPPYATRYVI